MSALSLIESYCGQSFQSRQVSERIPLRSNVGRLSHAPIVSIDAVSARSDEWAHASVFGPTEWASISPGDIMLVGDQLVVPGDVLDAHFTEADVTYTVGYADLPEPIRAACEILERHIDASRSAYAHSAQIPHEVVQLITPFCRGGDA